jgi:hypothetical protein
MEAVKQGSAVVGMKNATHAVVAAVKVCLLHRGEKSNDYTNLIRLFAEGSFGVSFLSEENLCHRRALWCGNRRIDCRRQEHQVRSFD